MWLKMRKKVYFYFYYYWTNNNKKTLKKNVTYKNSIKYLNILFKVLASQLYNLHFKLMY